MEEDEIKINKRCRKIKIKLGNSPSEKKKFNTIDSLSRSSKFIYNTALFCRRQWYSLHKTQIKYYVENIDQYIGEFSPDDRIKIAYFAKDNKEVIQKLIEHSHTSEISLRRYADSKIKQQLEHCEKTVQMEITDVLENIRNIEIGTNNTILEEYKSDIIQSIAHKNNVNGKREKTKEQLEKMKEKEEENKEKMDRLRNKYGNIVLKKSIIISSIPNAVVIDKFVKTKCSSYKDVSSQTAQQTIKKVEKSYKSFFESIKNSNIEYTASKVPVR